MGISISDFRYSVRSLARSQLNPLQLQSIYFLCLICSPQGRGARTGELLYGAMPLSFFLWHWWHWWESSHSLGFLNVFLTCMEWNQASMIDSHALKREAYLCGCDQSRKKTQAFPLPLPSLSSRVGWLLIVTEPQACWPFCYRNWGTRKFPHLSVS